MQAVQKQQKLPRDKKLSADKYHLLKLDERKRNMKSKFGLIRVLVVVFALVLSISLVSCVKDEDLDNVKNDAGKTQENVTQLQTDVKALQDKLVALTSEVKATTEAAATKASLDAALERLKTLETTNATYATQIEEIQTTLNATASAVENAATKAALKEVSDALEAAKTKVDGLETAKTTIEGKITALENTVTEKTTAINNELTSIKNQLNNFASKTDVTALTDRVAALESWKDTFADKKYLDDYISFTNKLKDDSYQYSAKNFWDAANEVAEGPYDDNEIKEFNKKIDTIALFLARAVTEEDAKWCFDQLAAAKSQLKTLEETLATKLNEFTVIANDTATKKAYANIQEAYAKLYAKDPVAAEGLTRYTLIKAAYENFFGADGTSGAVGAGAEIIAFVNDNLKDTMIVLGTSDTNVTDASSKYAAFVADYFANSEWNAFYGVVENGVAVNADAETVAESLANGKEIKGYARRIALLTEAKTYADSNIVMTFEWNNYNGGTDVRPLYTNTSNKALLDKITAWATADLYKDTSDFGTYTGCAADIEAENIYAILGEAAYKDLQTSVNYVAAMLNIYENFTTVDEATLNVKTAIIDEITKLISGDVVIDVTNDAAMKALQALIADMDARIEAVENYNAATDNNKLEMVAQAVRDNAKAFVDAYKTVTDAIGMIKTELYPDGDIEKMTFTSFKQYAKIETFKTTVETACETLKTTLAANSVTAPEAIFYVDGELQNSCLLAKLYAAYNTFTADAWDAYKSADEAIKAVEDNGVKLDMGNQIRTAFNLINKAVVKFGLGPDDMIVPKAGEGVAPVNFNKLSNRLQTCLNEYKTLAETAEPVAADLNAKIDALASLNTSDLNNYKQITNVMNEFINNWLRKVDEAGNTVFFTKDISVENALTLTQNVLKQGSVSETYKFVDADKYNNILNVKNNEMVATYEAAKVVIEAWMQSANDVMAEEMTIHTTAYNTVFEAYNNVKAYYIATELGNDNQLFEEYTLYVTFKAKYDEYTEKVANATAAADEIRNLIDALPAIDKITLENYTTVATSIATINAKLDAYIATYCDGDCQFLANGENNTAKKDYLVILAKVEGVVNYLTKTVEASVAEGTINANLANLVSALAGSDSVVDVEALVEYYTKQAQLPNA